MKWHCWVGDQTGEGSDLEFWLDMDDLPAPVDGEMYQLGEFEIKTNNVTPMLRGGQTPRHCLNVTGRLAASGQKKGDLAPYLDGLEEVTWIDRGGY